MREVTVQRSFESWRAAARGLLAEGVAPAEVLWNDGSEGVLPGLASDAGPGEVGKKVAVPREFLEIAALVACHRESQRWGLLYRVLWRMTLGGERHLLEIPVDADVRELDRMERAVRRDRHKMTAFVRFRLSEREGEPWYVAWHRPDHFIVRLTAPFFARRFAAMKWAILTPDDSVVWDLQGLSYGPGVPASEAPPADQLEDLWRTYYASTFNPARIKLKAMKRELPVRHWATLPETQLIPELLRDAPRRVEEMMALQRRSAKRPEPTGELFGRSHDDERTTKKGPEAPPPTLAEKETCRTATSAAEFLPAKIELPQLREAAVGCRGCELYCHATQTVFGEGPKHATLMFVGEQPGDQEDRAGRPFVGPAGQLLDDALREAGIPRDECYVTNAVKHFKFEPRGKRRIHAKPNAREITACRPWLESEIAAIKPKMIVCLGATAAQALLGREFRVTKQRGQPLQSEWAPWMMATVHPSSLLRIPDDAERKIAYAEFINDLKTAAQQLAMR